MAVQTQEPDRLETSGQPDDAAEIGVADDPRHNSGLMLPLVHTSINAALVTGHGGHRVLITFDRTEVETPPIEHLAFYVGLGALVGAGLVELPIAVALGVGHVLIDLTRRPGLQALGQALEEGC